MVEYLVLLVREVPGMRGRRNGLAERWRSWIEMYRSWLSELGEERLRPGVSRYRHYRSLGEVEDNVLWRGWSQQGAQTTKYWRPGWGLAQAESEPCSWRRGIASPCCCRYKVDPDQVDLILAVQCS